jgi:hypothetical protein
MKKVHIHSNNNQQSKGEGVGIEIEKFDSNQGLISAPLQSCRDQRRLYEGYRDPQVRKHKGTLPFFLARRFATLCHFRGEWNFFIRQL